MKKIFLITTFSFLLILTYFLPGSVYATTILTEPALLGKQQHSYSVVFRGNGEAVVSSKLIVSNIQDTSITQLSLRVPKVDPQDVIAFQVIKETKCIRYQPYTPGEISNISPPCIEYQEPNYYDYSTNKYQKATTEIKGDTIVVTLPAPIQSNKSSSIILYYRAFGYAKKNIFGTFNFAFETLKIDDRINNLTVGITTDSDLFLKGAKGKVNYRFNENAISQLKTAPEFGVPAPNSTIDSFYQQIGQGSITKTATSLQPLDSYTVKGSYADSILSLYAKELLIAIFIFLLIITVIVRLMKGKSGILKLSLSNSLVFTLCATRVI